MYLYEVGYGFSLNGSYENVGATFIIPKIRLRFVCITAGLI